MKYEVNVQGRQVSVQLEQRDGCIHAQVEERTYDLQVLSPEEAVYTFISGDEVYETHVWAADSNSLRVLIRGHLFATNIIDRKHRQTTTEHRIEGRQNLIAPMPGKVVRVLLRTGDEVDLGQGVVVVEAMKMQNEIKSPKSGRVVEIRVSEGATVNASQVLAVVE